MAYFIRDDREAPGYRGIGQPIISESMSERQDDDGRTVFMHATRTVAHDSCTHEHGAGGHPWDEGRKAFAAMFGPGHAWCWGPVWSNKPDTDPCYFCGEPVVGPG